VSEDVATSTVSRAGRTALGITALIAAFGLVLNIVITVLGTYPSTQTNATIYGYDNPDGLAGVVGRTLDFLSYFTILSNVVVVIVLVALWRGRIGPTPVWRALRMDSLLMITVTGLIFVIVLRPEAHLEGLQYITNTTEHYITPVLTVVTWLIWGPRGWFRLGTVFAALVVPLLWVAYALARGAVIDAYPYGFLDVATLGWGKALVNIGGVLVLGIVLGFIFLGIDKLLSRRK
jgi:hypothetical protein